MARRRDGRLGGRRERTVPVRVAVTLLVLAAALPGWGLAVWRDHRAVGGARTRVLHEADETGARVAQQVGALFDRTGTALALLARQPEVVTATREPDARCADELAEALEATAEIVNLGVAAVNGDVHCSGVPLTTAANVGDRGYFLHALGSPRLAVGVRQVGRITNRDSINVAVPVTVRDRVAGVSFAALDLDAVAKVAVGDHDARVVVFDRSGTVLARVAAARPRGSPLPPAEIWRRYEGDGSAFDGGDGYVYSVVPANLGSTGEPSGVVAAVGVDRRPLDALERQIRLDVVALTAMVSGVAALLLVLAGTFVVNPLRRLADATSQLRAGRWSPPQRHRTGASEVVALTDAFAEMVDDLDDRHAQLAREQALLTTILDGLDEGIVAYDADLEPVVQNRSLRAIAHRIEDRDQPIPLAATSSDGSTWEEMLVRARAGRVTDHAEFLVPRPAAPPRVLVATARSVGPGSQGDRTVVVAVNDVTGHRAVEAELDQRKHVDAVTGLPNREALERRLDDLLGQVPGRTRAVAVIFLDLRNFKLVNDSLGHEAGDGVLAAAAERLAGAVRSPDLAARFGSDEFVVVCADVHHDEVVTGVCRRLLRVFDEQVEIDGHAIDLSATVGCAVIDEPGVSASDALSRASTALHEAKRHPRHQPVLYDDVHHRSSANRLALEFDLRRAVEREQLVLHYQPVITIATGAVASFEALARWHHPTRGLVPPDVFIPIAEDLDVIVPIGRWALVAACQQIRAWRDATGDDLRVAVNVSGKQLRSGSLIGDIRDALDAARLPAPALTIEITESVLVDVPDVTTQLQAVRRSGVKVAIDDFGTGYSSLAYLQDLPADIVKIDQAFVHTLDSSRGIAIVTAMVGLVHELGMVAVAEGVETADHARRLQETGCRLAQGYYYARPGPAADFTSDGTPNP